MEFTIISLLMPLTISSTIPDWKRGMNTSSLDCEHPHGNFLRKMKRLGFSPNGILDIGANRGTWSCHAWEVFAEYKPIIFMIEESQSYVQFLNRLPFEYMITNVVDIKGEQSPHQDSSWLWNSANKKLNYRNEFISQTSQKGRIDDMVSEWYTNETNANYYDQSIHSSGGFKIQLLKISVQSQEISILNQLTNLIKNIEVIIIEAALVSWKQGSFIANIVMYLHQIGYEIYDIADMHRNQRPGKRFGELLQLDVVFIRNTSMLLNNINYSKDGVQMSSFEFDINL
jgi:hypothetical protein